MRRESWLRRVEDNDFRLSDRQIFWLVAGPAMAYALPYAAQKLARTLMGP